MFSTFKSIKLKYKIQILNKMIKANPSEFSLYQSKTPQEEKLKQNFKFISQKHSLRNSTIENYASLPGYERLFQNLSDGEKEETLNLMNGINFKTLSIIFQILNLKEFYKKIKSKVGVEAIKNSFREVVVKSIYRGKEEESLLIISDECEAYLCLKEVMSISELEAIEVFDLFKHNEYSAITEQNFIVIIYLLAASEDGMVSDFMKNFTEILFDFISGTENIVSVSRLIELDRFIGLNESQNYKAKSNLQFNSLIDLETFREVYSGLAEVHDILVKNNSDVIHLSDQKQNKKQTVFRKKETI